MYGLVVSVTACLGEEVAKKASQAVCTWRPPCRQRHFDCKSNYSEVALQVCCVPKELPPCKLQGKFSWCVIAVTINPKASTSTSEGFLCLIRPRDQCLQSKIDRKILSQHLVDICMVDQIECPRAQLFKCMCSTYHLLQQLF